MGPLSDYPPDLRRTILKLWRPSSLFWAFRSSSGLDRRKAHEVEIRIDVPPERLAGGLNFPGWRVVEITEDGRVFLRREQPLTNAALRQLFREAVVLAHAYDGGFRSWMHKPDLED